MCRRKASPPIFCESVRKLTLSKAEQGGRTEPMKSYRRPAPHFRGALGLPYCGRKPRSLREASLRRIRPHRRAEALYLLNLSASASRSLRLSARPHLRRACLLRLTQAKVFLLLRQQRAQSLCLRRLRDLSASRRAGSRPAFSRLPARRSQGR